MGIGVRRVYRVRGVPEVQTDREILAGAGAIGDIEVQGARRWRGEGGVALEGIVVEVGAEKDRGHGAVGGDLDGLTGLDIAEDISVKGAAREVEGDRRERRGVAGDVDAAMFAEHVVDLERRLDRRAVAEKAAAEGEGFRLWEHRKEAFLAQLTDYREGTLGGAAAGDCYLGDPLGIVCGG